MVAQVNLATASQMFDPTVTVIAQNRKYLGATIKERHGTTGDATNVPVSTQIEMQNIGFAASDIPVTPINNTNNLVVPFNYGLKTVIGGGYRTLFAYDTIVDQMIDHGLAVGRNDDFIKLNALFNSSGFGDIPVIPYTVGLNSGLNSQKLTTGLSTMADAGWDVSALQVAVWAAELQRIPLFADPLVTNFFYNTQKPLSNNKIQGYLDLDMRFLGNQGINSIPFTTSMGVNTYLIPLVHTNAMVQTYNRDPSSRVNWLDWQDRYDLLSTMTSGANVIQYSGIVLLECKYPFTNNSAEDIQADGQEIMTVNELLAARKLARPTFKKKPDMYRDPDSGIMVPVLKPAHQNTQG